MSVRIIVCLLSLWALGCSGRRLPPGTPPPEYEQPVIAPWTSEGADAGAAQAQEQESDASIPPSSGPEPELSLDAGPR